MLVWARFVPHTIKRSQDGTREQVREKFAVVLPSGRVKYIKRTYMRRVKPGAEEVVEQQSAGVELTSPRGKLSRAVRRQMKQRFMEKRSRGNDS